MKFSYINQLSSFEDTVKKATHFWIEIETENKEYFSSLMPISSYNVVVEEIQGQLELAQPISIWSKGTDRLLTIPFHKIVSLQISFTSS